jgi:hypothetical protein
MEALSGGGSVSGNTLHDGLEQLLQTIWGEFEATEPGVQVASVVIRAVDSSRWEVVSDDAAVLASIRRRFRVVEE